METIVTVMTIIAILRLHCTSLRGEVLVLQGRDQVRYSVKCSFLEIYNETITDLLKPSSGNLNLREDMKRGCYVDNLTEQIVLNGMLTTMSVCTMMICAFQVSHLLYEDTKANHKQKALDAPCVLISWRFGFLSQPNPVTGDCICRENPKNIERPE